MAGIVAVMVPVLLRVLAAEVGPPAGQETVSQPHPEVHPLAGDMRVWRAGPRSAEKVTVPVRVAPLDRLGSERGTVARLAVEPDLLATLKGVEAGRDQGLSVERAGRKLVLKLHLGSVIVETVEADIAVETPHGTVEGKAVYFLVEVTRHSARVVAIDGKLTLTNALGRVELDPGQSSKLGERSPPKAEPAGNLDGSVWAGAMDATVNLVKNPGFEEDLSNWGGASSDGKRLASVDEKVVHTGQKSAHVHFPGIRIGPDTGTVHAAVRQPVGKVLKQGQRYFLRMWVRTENYTVDGKPAQVEVVINYEGTANPTQAYKGYCPPAEKFWRCARFFLVAKGDFLQLDLASGTDKVYSGTVWLDDVFVCEVPEPARPDK